MNAPAHRDSVYAYPRAGWISLLNRAPREALMQHWHALGLAPAYDWIRKPEFGLVMLRGRVGGSGARFNLGEATVTRCALRLRAMQEGSATPGHLSPNGAVPVEATQAGGSPAGAPIGVGAPIVGLGMVLGRDAERVRAAALLDALLQDPSHFDHLLHAVLRPLEAAVAQARALGAAQAAATRVEFFTMVRGD